MNMNEAIERLRNLAQSEGIRGSIDQNAIEFILLNLKGSPQVTRHGIFDMQVCVPASYTNRQVKDFAESAYRCGTSNGWSIRKKGSKYLKGDLERQPCNDREGYVHIMLDA